MMPERVDAMSHTARHHTSLSFAPGKDHLTIAGIEPPSPPPLPDLLDFGIGARLGEAVLKAS
jgi:hypothetical protein